MRRLELILVLLVVCGALCAASYRELITFKVGTVTLGTASYKDTDSGVLNIKSNCVTETVNSGAGTETITAVIPAKAVSLGITCRVDTVIVGAGATSFNLGDGVDADLYGAAVAFAAGTTVSSSDLTASPLTQAFGTAAKNLTMTANAGQLDSGVITCCSHYIDSTAPTS